MVKKSEVPASLGKSTIVVLKSHTCARRLRSRAQAAFRFKKPTRQFAVVKVGWRSLELGARRSQTPLSTFGSRTQARVGGALQRSGNWLRSCSLSSAASFRTVVAGADDNARTLTRTLFPNVHARYASSPKFPLVRGAFSRRND